MFNLIKYVILKMQNKKIGYDYNDKLTLRTSIPKYGSYGTRYVSGRLDSKFNLPNCIPTHACFGSYFSHVYGAKEVNEFVLIELDLKKPGDSHFVIMSPEQCLRFASYFSEMLGYTVELIKPENEKLNCVYLKINFKNTKYLTVKFVLTWVRYLWESAYSFCSYDALRMFDYGIFPELDLYNLMDLVMGSLTVDGNSYNSGHFITRGAGFVSLDKLESYILTSGNSDVNCIQQICSTYNIKNDRHGEGHTCKNTARISTMEQVLVNDRFLERVEIYKKNYEAWKGN